MVTEEQPPSPTNSDALRRARELVAKLRTNQLREQEIAEEAKEIAAENQRIQDRELTTLFGQLGITHLGIEATGNLPAFEARLKDYYRANIAASWPEDKRKAAHDWLEKNAPGLMKTVITIVLPRGTAGVAKKIVAALRKFRLPSGAPVEFELERTVQHNTLSAWLREYYEVRMKKSKNEPVPPLALLGATVGQTVAVGPSKEKK